MGISLSADWHACYDVLSRVIHVVGYRPGNRWARAAASGGDGLTEGRPPLRVHTSRLRLARPPSTVTWNLFNHLQFQLLWLCFVSTPEWTHSNVSIQECALLHQLHAQNIRYYTHPPAFCLLIIALGTAKVTDDECVLCHEWAEPNATTVHSKKSSALALT